MRQLHADAMEIGYNASPFIETVEREGAVSAAKKLVNSPAPSEGFTKLWELRRLDISVEALVLRREFAPCSRARRGSPHAVASRSTGGVMIVGEMQDRAAMLLAAEFGRTYAESSREGWQVLTKEHGKVCVATRNLRAHHTNWFAVTNLDHRCE